MKINSSKFGIALGIALSVSFLFCNIIFAICGKDFSLSIVNTLFHEMDFKPIMIENGFSFGKLICGMLILFLEGLFIGYVTAFIYNSISKKETK